MSDLSGLQDIALFVEVARQSSFIRASRKLGISAATLSRRVAAMEERLGTRLFHRTTRRVELTDPGRRYFARCEHLADEARLAEEALRDDSTRPTGCVRASMPVDFGVHTLGPLLPEFARGYPSVTLELDLSPTHRDLIGERVDVAIRLGTVQPPHLVSRRIGWIDQVLLAAPSYLGARGHPSSPSELAQHECIVVAGGDRHARWRLTRRTESVTVTVRGRFSINSQGLMRSMCVQGMGIAAIAAPLWRDDVREGRLAFVLPDWRVPRIAVHAVTASRSQPAAVRAFVEFLAARIAAA